MGKVLTISIAAYNVEKFIGNTLNSLIFENMEKIEVLIENDGSTDNTSKIAHEYANKYPGTFKVIDKNNGGYGSTINKSISIAKGKYFKQLDGDDWFKNESMDALISLLEKIDIECVYTPLIEIYEASKIEKLDDITKFLKVGEYNIKDVMKYGDSFLKMHCLIFKTELLLSSGMQILEHCFYTDQEYIIYPVLNVKNVYISDIPVYCYRLELDGQSMSKSGLRKHYQDHAKVILKILEHYTDINNCDDITRNYICTRLCDLINTQYICYLLNPPCKKIKMEMKEFDSFLKQNYSEIYYFPNTVKSRYVSLLKLTRFNFYNLISKIIDRKM